MRLTSTSQAAPAFAGGQHIIAYHIFLQLEDGQYHQIFVTLQVVSLKMCLHPDIVERLNRQLPPAVRVFGYHRVTNGFDARKLCDRCKPVKSFETL